MQETHVVHTFNVNRDLQGTVEKLPGKVARSLIRTGRARAATDEEIATGEAAVPELAEDQAPLGTAAAPAQEGGPASAPAIEQASPPDVPSTGSAPGGKVAAVPKPSGSKAIPPPGPSTSGTTTTSTSGDAAGK